MNEAYREAAAQLERAIRYLAEAAGLKPGAAVVLGCSTSEVAGGHIGKNSVPELGDALAETMIAVCGELGLCPVFQCCEHLNRALVMEQAPLDRLRLTQVNVMPVPTAGGSTGAAAYRRFEHPAVAQFIQADAAIGAGAMTVSHANDSYFWVVTNFGEMEPQDGYKTQTLGTLVIGIAAIINVLLISAIF